MNVPFKSNTRITMPGIANAIGIRLGVGTSGSAWAVQTISGLVASASSDTTILLEWTNDGVENYDGHKIYISTNGVSYTLNATTITIAESTTVTGLIAETLYYFKVAAYKGVKIGPLSNAASDTTFNTLYSDVYSAMDVQPSKEIAGLQNTLIDTIRDGGIFPSKVARLFLTGSHAVGSSIIDFVDPTRKATFVNGVGFEVNKGMKAVGAGQTSPSYLDLGFNPTTENDKYTQNSAGMGVFIQTNAIGNYIDMGVSDGTVNCALNMRAGTGTMHITFNDDNTGYDTNIANSDSTGFYFVTRRGVNGGTTKYIYKNKIETAISVNSNGVPNRNFWGLTYNNSGSSFFDSARQNGLIILTSGLTTAEENILSDAVNAYFTAVASATYPYIKYPDSYKALSICDPLTKLYFDGTRYPIVGTDSGRLMGTPVFNATGLSLINTGYSMGVTAIDGIEFWHNQAFNFTKDLDWCVEFLINFSAIGLIIKKDNGTPGWIIYINAQRRIQAEMLHDVGDDDYIVQQSDEVLEFNTTYHVIVQFNNVSGVAVSGAIPKIIITINGRENITYPQYEPKAVRSLVGDITNTEPLVIAGSGLVGNIDELAVYYKLGNYGKLQQRTWMAIYDSSFPIPTLATPTQPVNAICESAHDLDPQDAGDTHFACALDALGEINLLLINSPSSSSFTAPSMQAIADWWESNVEISAYQGSDGRVIDPANPLSPYPTIRDDYKTGETKATYTDDLIGYRTALASAPNNSVYIFTTGYFKSLHRLLLSPADGISPLTGMELATAKIVALFQADYIHPIGGYDPNDSYNGLDSPASWKYVLDNAPFPIYFSGLEMANTFTSGPPVLDPDDYLTNPVRFAYEFQPLQLDKRPVFGQLQAIAVARGISGRFILSHPFDLVVDNVTARAVMTYSQTGKFHFLRWATGWDTAKTGSVKTEIDTIFALTKDTV